MEALQRASAGEWLTKLPSVRARNHCEQLKLRDWVDSCVLVWKDAHGVSRAVTEEGDLCLHLLF